VCSPGCSAQPAESCCGQAQCCSGSCTSGTCCLDLAVSSGCSNGLCARCCSGCSCQGACRTPGSVACQNVGYPCG
jgi:hypothetical protein